MRKSRRELSADRTAGLVRKRLVEDLDRLCSDAGVSHAALARAAGVPSSFLARIFAGTAKPSIETYAKLTTALGVDLHARLYPNTGPAIRDRHSIRMLEPLLQDLHPRWRRFLEVAVRRPARGWIDLVLHEQRERVVLASELQSGLHRLEQLIRWSTEKAASLASWDGWQGLGDEPAISRLMVVRWTRDNREIARAAAQPLRVAYPAHPDDALEALTGVASWPGPALIWARDDRGRYRLVGGR